MVITQVGENHGLVIDDVIGIQISIVLLCGTYDIDGFVSRFFKLRIRLLGKGIAHSLDPFGKIAVLEQTAVKTVFQMIHILRQRLENQGPFHFFICIPLFSFLFRNFACNFEIAHAEAWLRIGKPVVQGFPLIGDNLLADQFHFFFPEGICYLYLSQRYRSALLFLIHISSILSVRTHSFGVCSLVPPVPAPGSAPSAWAADRQGSCAGTLSLG